MSERTVQRVGAKVVVRSIDNAGCTMRALTVTFRLRLQGSALAAALARPDVLSALTDVSWRTGAGQVTGVSVVCGDPEPELTALRAAATGAVSEGEVVWRGSETAATLHTCQPTHSPFQWSTAAKVQTQPSSTVNTRTPSVPHMTSGAEVEMVPSCRFAATCRPRWG